MRRSGSLVCLLIALLMVLPAAAAPDAKAQPENPSGWLGVMLGSAGDAALTADTNERSGVPIKYVVEDSPAADAGLRARDEILDINGTPVTSASELLAQLRREAPGNWIPMTLKRRGDERELRVRLAARPKDMRRLQLRRGWLGVKSLDLPPDLREHFGAPRESGVMIAGIVEGSPGEVAGFMLGDIVYEMDGEPIRSPRDLVQQVSGGGVGNEVEITVIRGGADVVLEALLEAVPPKPEKP